jgi:hypothetical protein
MCGKVQVLIEDWAVVGVPPSPYRAPELTPQMLQGRVFGHPDPKHEDGTLVQTSAIVSIDLERRRIETENTVYLLGTVQPKYLLAAQRLATRPETVAMLKKHWGEAFASVH